MNNPAFLFANRSFDFGKLIEYGFSEKGKDYIYYARLPNGQFDIKVTVSKTGKITADVFDSETREVYVLVKLPEATGKFIGQIKAEYEAVLKDIREKCSRPEVFKNNQTRAVLDYAAEKYGDEPEFLWENSPLNAVLRRKDNKKWYAALLVVAQNKLGLPGEEKTEIIDLRMASNEVEIFTDYKIYFPGYHMNKKHWITIPLDSRAELQEILFRLDCSYELAKK